MYLERLQQLRGGRHAGACAGDSDGHCRPVAHVRVVRLRLGVQSTHGVNT